MPALSALGLITRIVPNKAATAIISQGKLVVSYSITFL
jgi:hypothetical protein